MATRSRLMSVALIAVPNFILISFRISSSEFNEALTNDNLSEIALHFIALLLGIILVYRSSAVKDHEYHRSKTIDRLSSIYRKEDKGLWNKGEDAINKLEAKAHSSIRGRKASLARDKMQGRIGSLNKESIEIDTQPADLSSYSIRVDGIEQKTEQDSQSDEEGKNIGGLKNLISKIIDRSAEKRISRKSLIETNTDNSEKGKSSESYSESLWDIPAEKNFEIPSKACEGCGSYNAGGANYCSSCGSFLTQKGNL